MSILIATTKISVYSRAQEDESETPYAASETPSKQLKSSGVRAVIGSSAGNEVINAGTQQSITRFSLDCDPCSITHEDIVVDEVTGLQFEILWVVPIQGLGISYMRGIITLSKGTEYVDI